MPAVTSSQNVDLVVLTQQTAVGGILESTLVHLFTNNFAPSKVSVLADFTEATFDGYVAAAIAGVGWTAAYLNAVANAERSTLAQVEFLASGVAVQESIWGYYLTDNPATVVRFAERFAAAVPMGISIGQRIGMILRFVLDKSGLDGSAAQNSA